jgi:Ni/Fe-hydrogenase subunit HybB-like protein
MNELVEGVESVSTDNAPNWGPFVAFWAVILGLALLAVTAAVTQ